jgi:hypothetical protein
VNATDLLLVVVTAVITWLARGDRDRAVIGRLLSERGRWRKAWHWMRADRDRWRAVAEEGIPRLGDHGWLARAVEGACGELLPGERTVAVTVQALADGPAVVLVSVTDGGDLNRTVQFPLPLEDDEDGTAVQGWAFERIDLPAADSPEWGARGDG